MEKLEQPMTFRPEPDTRKAIDQWLKTNPSISRSSLINMAVRKFTSQPQTLEPVEIVSATDKEVMKAGRKLSKVHAHAVEKLK